MRVFIICMKERLSQGEELARKFASLGFQPEMVDAVVGKDPRVLARAVPKLSLVAHAHMGRPRLAHYTFNTPGAIGCYLSHLLCWQKVAAQTNVCLVVEEDMRLDMSVDPVRIIRQAARAIDQQLFDLVTVAYSSLPKLSNVEDCLVRLITPFTGTLGYVVGPRGAAHLIKGLGSRIEGHIDYMIGLFALASAQNDDPFLLGASGTNCWKIETNQSLVGHGDNLTSSMNTQLLADMHKHYYNNPRRYSLDDLSPAGRDPLPIDFSLQRTPDGYVVDNRVNDHKIFVYRGSFYNPACMFTIIGVLSALVIVFVVLYAVAQCRRGSQQ